MKKISLEIIKKIIEDNYKAISYDIFLGTENIGSCSVMVDENYAYCDCIGINEQFRNQGYGSQALEWLSQKYGG